MQLKNHISKEVFKTYFCECPKVAVALSTIDVLKKTLAMAENNKITILATEVDEANTAASPIDPIKTFMAALQESDDEEDKLKMEILQDIQDQDGALDELGVSESILNGNQFGQAVREYFYLKNARENSGQDVKKTVVDLQSETMKAAFEQTKEIVSNPDVRYVFEAVFKVGNELVIRPDVLELRENNHVAIYEAKASSTDENGPLKGKETIHLLDLAFQVYVLRRCGFIVDDVALVYLDKSYTRDNGRDPVMLEEAESFKEIIKEKTYDFQTDVKPLLDSLKAFEPTPVADLDYEQLISIRTATKKQIPYNTIVDNVLEEMEPMLAEIDAMINFVSASDDNMHEFYTRIMCQKLSYSVKNGTISYKSVFCAKILDYFDATIPNLLNVLKPAKFAEFIAKYHITALKDLDMDNLFSYCYTTKSEEKPFLSPTTQSKIKLLLEYDVKGTINDKDLIIGDPEMFRSLMWQYRAPIYMFDFETAKWAIPVFNRQTPYYQTVFQYSIHTIKKDDVLHDIDAIYHKGWLPKLKRDPRPEFIYRFLRDAYEFGPGTWVSYNKAFENQILRRLAASYPRFAPAFLYICQHTIDLWDFFRYDVVYHPDFKRSTSIKYVQPALYPALSYKDLIVNKGDKAAFMFRQFIDGLLVDSDGDDIWETIHWDAMFKYCNRDTLAMIAVYKRLLEIKKAYNEGKDKNEKI